MGLVSEDLMPKAPSLDGIRQAFVEAYIQGGPEDRRRLHGVLAELRRILADSRTPLDRLFRNTPSGEAGSPLLSSDGDLFQLSLDFPDPSERPPESAHRAEDKNPEYHSSPVLAENLSLKALCEFTRSRLEAHFRRADAISGPAVIKDYLIARLGPQEREVFASVFLDNRHRVIAYEELFFGTIDGCSVHPREVVKRALLHNAAALLFAHNHPSGVPAVSQADENITQKLKAALALIDVRVLDHIVVGGGEAVSFAERGML